MEIIGDSETLKLVPDSDCYNILDDHGVVVGKIVPRMIEDEIWVGVNEALSDKLIELESRGKWCVNNTSYVFYNIICDKY